MQKKSSMDEQRSQQEAEILAARSATALRVLEERARLALAASREQTSSLEATITRQFDEIAAALASERTAESQSAAEEAQLRAEIDRLNKELINLQAVWSAERSGLESACDEQAKEVETLQAELRTARNEWSNKLAEAEAKGTAGDGELRAEISRITKQSDESRAAWLLDQSALEEARDALAKQLADLQTELRTVRDESASRLAEAEARSASHDSDRQAEIERLTKELEDSRAAWLKEQSTLEAARDELTQQVAQLQAADHAAESQSAAEDVELRAEVDRLTKQLAESRADSAAEQLALEAARDELAKQVAKLQVDERAARDDWAKQLTCFEEKLREQQQAWNNQRTEWSVARATLELERDSLQQKFELALQDVQRFRGRVAELEQELSRRPEAMQADSAELVALRAERDALAERVEQLERQPAVQIDANAEQQVADLQRRFELAVEDVRELKTKNAQLEAKLASAVRPVSRAADAGGLDWESQKRRLLASLEDEGDASDEPVRQEERIRIESTIEMTDAVVAEKDREIAELKSQLAQGGAAASAAAADEENEQQVRELVDADEVIAEHRKRTAEMAREMEDKLRAAELELSLSRAKIARERVELDELRADLESQRANMGPDSAGTPGAPRRRWLSKLGLSGEEP
jgi:hypothetical protein